MHIWPCTRNVPVGASGGFSFTFSTSEGAILLMPEGGSQENLCDKGTFMDQALKHGLAWYEYANVTCRQLPENGSLYLVTRCDKTTSWGSPHSQIVQVATRCPSNSQLLNLLQVTHLIHISLTLLHDLWYWCLHIFLCLVIGKLLMKWT